MKKLTKKQKMKKLDKECMSLWHDIVFHRDAGRCVLCGSMSKIQVHHIFTRKSHFSVRHYTDNGVCLCQGCHFKLHTLGTQELGVWLVGMHGLEWFEQLRILAKQIVHDKLQYLESVFEDSKGVKEKIMGKTK